jgi:putative phage-type endonuclease
MLTAQQLETRRHGIGGSDIGAICGLSPYKTPVDVYLSKVEPAEPYSASPQAHWGSLMEPLLAQDYAIRHQVALDHPEQRSHAVHDWALGNVDALVPKQAVVEFKTVWPNSPTEYQFGEEGTDRVPDSYLAQVLWYLAIFDLPRAHIVAMFMRSATVREYVIERQAPLESMLLERGRLFWENHIVMKQPPAPTKLTDVDRLFKRGDEGLSIEATPDLSELCAQLKVRRDELKRITKESEDLEIQIKAEMGNAATLTWESKPIVTWKNSTSKVFDQKQFAADYPGMAEKYKVPRETRRFLVK